jgi:hypothetical protein
MARTAREARLLELPPLEGWPTFHGQFRARWQQGQHLLFVGPTGSGKTVAARTLAEDRQFVIVLGTKMRDPEMEAYLEAGYVRCESWPPTRKQLKPLDDGSIRLVLWPKIRNRVELRSHGPMFARCLDQLLVDGGWTVVVDEGLWCSSRDGLNLGTQLEAIAYTGRSSGVTLMMLLQRPAGVPRNTWSNASYAFLWKHGVTNDTRELASLGTEDPKTVGLAITQLEEFQFLYLPCRAGSGWTVSKVDL